jgi:hypothetical protein
MYKAPEPTQLIRNHIFHGFFLQTIMGSFAIFASNEDWTWLKKKITSCDKGQ